MSNKRYTDEFKQVRGWGAGRTLAAIQRCPWLGGQQASARQLLGQFGGASLVEVEMAALNRQR